MSNYILTSDIFMTPLKRPVVDEGGNLRLHWWEGNDALKGPPVATLPTTLRASSGEGNRATTTWLPAPGAAWNHTRGIVVSGMLTVERASQVGGASVGFGFEALGPSQWAPTVPAPPINSVRQIMMSVEPVVDRLRQTVIADVQDGPGSPPNVSTVDVSGVFPCGTTTCSDATKMSVSPNRSHSFILLARQGMFELYVDGQLVQYHVYGECAFTTSGIMHNVTAYPYPEGSSCRRPGAGMCRECTGRIGLVVNGTSASVQLLRGWQMSLSLFQP